MVRPSATLEKICRELSDEHDYLYGIPVEVVSYAGGICEICNSMIDEFGYCACGGPAD